MNLTSSVMYSSTMRRCSWRSPLVNPLQMYLMVSSSMDGAWECCEVLIKLVSMQVVCEPV